MSLKIRKIVRYTDETYIEGGKPADRPWIMVAVAAVIQNPWAGQGFVEDLRSTILEVAPPLVIMRRSRSTILTNVPRIITSASMRRSMRTCRFYSNSSED